MEKQINSNFIWLIVGGLCGLMFAGYGMFTRIGITSDFESGVIATVNNTAIVEETYLRALDRYNSDTKNQLNDDDRKWVLQRLIEEELLVQRGLDLGMLNTDNDVRGAIVRALIASLNNEAAAVSPSEKDLINYYEAHKERFTYPATVAVNIWTADTKRDALLLQQSIEENTGPLKLKNTRFLKNIPDGLLTINKLREYVGPSLVSLILAGMEKKVVMHSSQGRWYIVKIKEKRDSITEPYDDIKYQVQAEYMRFEADRILRDYINNLKDNAAIKIIDQYDE